MLTTIRAVIRQGRIEPLENIPLPEGDEVLVTLLSEDSSSAFWLRASQPSLEAIWDNDEDDIYADLLQK